MPVKDFNCFPAPNAPFNKYMLCDHRWVSFKHFSFTMSRMLHFPARERWRDTEQRVCPMISISRRISSLGAVVKIFSGALLQPRVEARSCSSSPILQPQPGIIFLRPIPRETPNSAEKKRNCLCMPGFLLPEPPPVPQQAWEWGAQPL